MPSIEQRRTFGFRGWIALVGFAVIIVLFSLRGLAGFYTDYLWFDSIGQGSTWSRLLEARAAPALVFTAVFFVIMLANLVIADRAAPRYRSTGPEDEWIARYQQVAGPYMRRIRVGVSLFFALIEGVVVSSQWRQWILYTHRVDFGVKDPQFNKDVGFYIFQLPFIEFIVQWLFAGLLIVLVITAVEHYLNGGIRFQSPFQRVTPQVKAHLSVILGVMALVKTAQYYFGRYELAFSTRGYVEGASATDVKAQLPALNLLIFISVVAAILFVWNIRRRGWVLPTIAVGLWAFVSLVVGTIYPAFWQRFKVHPNEYQAEQQYIERNITATRAAFDIGGVQSNQFSFTSFDQIAQPADVVNANLSTIDNARLWDPNVALNTFSNLQALQTYYGITDVDIDRYQVNSRTRQVLIAARGLESGKLPSQSFVNRHIVYTHGYGLVAAPSNAVTSDGSPDFVLQDVPVAADGIDLQNGSAARIYFGEGLQSYVLVGAVAKEFDYQTQGNTDASTRYKGKDGVALSNLLRRAAFSLRFGDLNPLISGQVTSNTKILLERDIVSRVNKLAPFLELDADPYPVALGDHVVWVLDGYTTSDRYPYAQATPGSGGLSGDFNYVRNSVKVTVDAYDGTVTFYVVDNHDPIVRAYRKAFPGLFTDGSKMPDELRAHLRYPEDLFTLQANVFGRYHVTPDQSQRFYNGDAKWLVSPDPQSGLVSDISATTSQSSSSKSGDASSTGRRIEPYYLYLRLPGDTKESFVIVAPFVPVSTGDTQTRLVSFLTARSDPGEYGQMQAFEMPQGTTVLGPSQVANEIGRTTSISSQITLLNQQGSQVIAGSLQLIPVGNSLVYVRPYYVQSRGGGGFPKFQFVVVFTQGREAVSAGTVGDALAKLFGTSTATPVTPSTGTGTGSTTPTGASGTDVTKALDLLNQANDALRAGNLGLYQSLVDQARQLLASSSTSTASGSTTTTTTTTRPR